METLRICKARIMAVNKVKWTCTALAEGGTMGAIEDIPINPVLIGPQGQGMYYLPEVGSTVWLAELRVGGFFVLMGATLPFDGNAEDDTETLDMDHSMARAQLEPGDIVMTGKPGSQVLVRKSGVVEIGSSYMSKRFYLPLEHFIRDFTKNYEMLSAGGGFSFKTNEIDQRWGSVTAPVVADPTSKDGVETVTISKTPTKFQLSIKEFAQDKEPILELQAGRIELDSQDQLVGGQNWKDIVFELLLHNPSPNLDEQDGKKKGGSVRIYMDKRGTINQVFFGSRFTKVHETDVLIAANYERKVTGLDSQASQTRSITVEQSEKKVVKGLATHEYLGGLSVSVKGKFSTNLEAPLEIATGERKEIINGSHQVSVSGESAKEIARDRKIGVGGSSFLTAGGRIEIIAANKVGVKPTGLLLKTLGGKVRIQSVPGNGPTPYASGVEIITPGGTIICDDIGNIYLRSKSSKATVQINAQGVAVTTPGGEITLTNSGEVSLGAPMNSGGAGCGKVVTTLTHPFCYVTGLPIKGSDQVSAFSKVPIGTPGVKIPIVPYVNVLAAAEAAIKAANALE